MKSAHNPVVLVILDGWGWREETSNNGIAMAKTPVFDSLVKKYPFTLLTAAGEAVGLPEGQIGNSEVGHTAIGAGKIIYQDLVRITKAMKETDISTNPAFAQVFAHVTNRKSKLHIVGIFSPGGVHGHEDHFMEIARSARKSGCEVVLHPFLDGRDTPRTSGIQSLKTLQDFAANHGCVIGSVVGRYYAMDRDMNYDRTDKAVRAIFEGEAEMQYSTEVSPAQIVEEKYHSEVFDEHLEPMVFGENKVNDGDGIVFTNFRSDRARQLSARIAVRAKENDLCFVTMTDYGQIAEALVAFTPEERGVTLGEAIEGAELRQLHVAETEKFPHATYFLNGGREVPFAGEVDVMIPSRKDIKTHDEAPEMRAREISDAVLAQLDKFDFVFINYANPDMVGHTANQKAIIRAIEVVDEELGRIVEATLKQKGTLVIIADHGNAEVMVDPITGEPHTAHTTNLVPCILVGDKVGNFKLRNGGGLVDIAPTVLSLLEVVVPETMTGEKLYE